MNIKFLYSAVHNHSCKSFLAALIVVLMSVSGAAHAELVFGVQVGGTDTEWTGTGGLATVGLEESGREFGGFLQLRGDVVGLHGAISANNTELDLVCTDGNNVIRGFGKFENGLAYDLLAMLTVGGENVKVIAMLGASSLNIEATGNCFTGDTSATGAKAGAGLEFRFGNGRLQLTYEYADLGEIDILGSAAKLEVKHRGAFAKLGFSF